MKKTIFLFMLLFVLSIFFLSQKYEKKIARLRLENACQPNSIQLTKIDMLNQLDKQSLDIGKQEMLKRKLIVAGISRDNAKELPSVILHIEYIGSLFQDYKVIIFENDSKDGTKAILKNWRLNNPKVKILSKDFHNIKRPNHQFLADARNYYLEEIKMPEYQDYEMMMVMDMDMGLGIDVRGIEDSFSKIDQWSVVCSNGIKSTLGNKMYDFFAFRNDEFPWSPEEWQKICEQNDQSNKWNKVCLKGKKEAEGKDYSFLKGDWFEKDELYWKYIVSQGQKLYSVGGELLPVHSCFGGMAFYKLAFLNNCNYNSLRNDCEHVPFHECIEKKNKGKIFMNPNQVIMYD